MYGPEVFDRFHVGMFFCFLFPLHVISDHLIYTYYSLNIKTIIYSTN